MSESKPGPAEKPVENIGLSTGLQPGGTVPGKSPAAGVGSIGTGGGSSASRETGTVKRSGPKPADKKD
jgi:hypothetical protein